MKEKNDATTQAYGQDLFDLGGVGASGGWFFCAEHIETRGRGIVSEISPSPPSDLVGIVGAGHAKFFLVDGAGVQKGLRVGLAGCQA